MARKFYRTEEGISECYLEGVLRHSGSISGFIYVFTQLAKNSEGDGRMVMNDVDEALGRLLGELAANATLNRMRNDLSVDLENPLNWLSSETQPSTSIDEVIVQAAENLADPNFFIAEISGILSALIELKDVCHQRRESTTGDK